MMECHRNLLIPCMSFLCFNFIPLLWLLAGNNKKKEDKIRPSTVKESHSNMRGKKWNYFERKTYDMVPAKRHNVLYKRVAPHWNPMFDRFFLKLFVIYWSSFFFLFFCCQSPNFIGFHLMMFSWYSDLHNFAKYPHETWINCLVSLSFLFGVIYV
jgi:hypothetical protein